MHYTEVTTQDCAEWVSLALALWPYETERDMQDLFLKRIPSKKDAEMKMAKPLHSLIFRSVRNMWKEAHRVPSVMWRESM